MDAPIYNVPIPYTTPINGGFGPGRMLKVQGSVHPNARCFAINLQCGPSVNPRDDIALHLSPVLTAPPRVVRNSLQTQCWGPEESHGIYFPFSAGQAYEIIILAENDHFKLAINGSHFSEFHYRLPIQRVTYLAIDGETAVSMVHFSGTARAPSPSFGMPYIQQPSYPPSVGVPGHSGYPPAPPPISPYGQAPSLYPPGPTGAYGQAPMASPYGQASGPGGYGGADHYPGGGGGGGYPMQGQHVAYPHSPKSQHKSGLGAVLGGLPLAAGLGAAAGMLGGGHHGGHKGKHHKTSKAIPIGLGLGGAALAGAALMGHNPLKPKKLKKLYKHKHFKHKHKHGFGGFMGRSSSSSSD